MTVPTRRTAIALVLDLLSVAVFVVIGRRTHQEGSALAAVAKTMAPFVIALFPAWVVARVWERPTALQTGLIVWVITVLAGMFTRRVLFGEGIAPAFIIVATLFLGACFLGWRLIAARLPVRATPSTA